MIKFLVGCILALVLVLTSQAEELIPRLISVEVHASYLRQIPENVRIEVLGNGDVKKIRTRFLSSGENPEVVITDVTSVKESLPEIAACLSQLDAVEFTPSRSPCMDDPGIHYQAFHERREFAVRFCGRLQSITVPCVQGLIELLDSLRERSI